MGLSAPDTAIAVASRDLAHEASNDALYFHCERTFHFAAALGERDGWAYDAEVLYVASMLHDLGLTERYDGPGEFEEQGADAAHGFLTGLGWDAANADLVREAITFHDRIGTDDHDRKEVPLLRLGAAADFFGWRTEDLPPELIEGILQAHPRAGLKAALVEAFGSQIERKPDSWLALLNQNLDWLDRIRAAPFDE